MWLFIVFVVGYILIALEHPLRIDKAAVALLTGVVLWTLLILGNYLITPDGLSREGLVLAIEHHLLEHLSDISAILFFLLGAMTIVEIVDRHDGFRVITSQIKTTNKLKLIWILALVTFFLSAILDNLTTTIVMATLLRKILHKKSDLWIFGGLIVIAANSGGAWSPIGDVTTIMLWIGGQITAAKIITSVFLPGLVSLVVPLIIISFFMKGDIESKTHADASEAPDISRSERNLIFYMGVGALIFVPIFKNFTELPPFMGMLFGLGVLWVTTELMLRKKGTEHKKYFSVTSIIKRVDTPTILFFLGILLAVSALQTAGKLDLLAKFLDQHFSNIYVINMLIGLLSSVVDNVPLVAGAMGMYPMELYATDHNFWTLLAFCAGTGGSVLIIGSAAGVAIMGILKIDFIWYLKRISLLALAGYFAGIGVYMLLMK